MTALIKRICCNIKVIIYFICIYILKTSSSQDFSNTSAKILLNISLILISFVQSVFLIIFCIEKYFLYFLSLYNTIDDEDRCRYCCRY